MEGVVATKVGGRGDVAVLPARLPLCQEPGAVAMVQALRSRARRRGLAAAVEE